MVNELFIFFQQGIKAIIIGVLLLIMGLLFLPTNISTKIIKFIKPKIFENYKKKYIYLITTSLNLFINHSFYDVSIDLIGQEKNKKIQDLLISNSKIEKNIYAIDLCFDMIRTLSYVTGEQFSDTMQQAFGYLYHYANNVESFEQDLNFSINFLSKIQELQDLCYNFSKEDEHEDWKVNNYTATFASIIEFMKNEKIKIEEIYKVNSTTICSIIKAKVDEL